MMHVLGSFFLLFVSMKWLFSVINDVQEVTARVFMPLFECPSVRCKTNRTKGNLILQLRASKFLKFQEVISLFKILFSTLSMLIYSVRQVS